MGNTTAWRADAGDFANQRLKATYSGRNRLVAVERADAGGSAIVARYAYNAFGERIAKWTGAAAAIAGSAPSQQFAYDNDGRLLGRYTGNGALVGEYLWLDDTPIAVITPASAPQGGQSIPASGSAPAVQVYFVHPDHLDTPRVVLNAANQSVWQWESAPFGDTAADSNASGLGSFDYTLRFPGQQYDAETGQHYNYFRDYEASTGRYVQSDPIGLDGGPNPFAYVNSAPGAASDAFGLKAGHSPFKKDGLAVPNCSPCTKDKRSHDYQGLKYVYDIIGPAGAIHKVGVGSGTGFARCKGQAAALNAAHTGAGSYSCRRKKFICGTKRAEDYEFARQEGLRAGGHSLPGNQPRPRPR